VGGLSVLRGSLIVDDAMANDTLDDDAASSSASLNASATDLSADAATKLDRSNQATHAMRHRSRDIIGVCRI
jgi:hypothetical protein